MSDALKLVSDLETKVKKEDLPKLLQVLLPPQIGAAMAIFTAAKKKDVATVESSAKKLVSTMTPEQRPKLVAVLGEDIVKRLEAYK